MTFGADSKMRSLGDPSLPLGLAGAEPQSHSTLLLFNNFLQPRLLIGLQDRIHSILSTREDSLPFAQIERKQIAELCIHLSQDWFDFLQLLRLETQIPL